MRRQTFLFVAIALAGATVFAAAQSSSAPPGRNAASPLVQTGRAASVELSSLDRTVSACTDFYQFACGGWMTANPMPADRQRNGRFTEVQDRNFAILRQILEAPPADAGRRLASDYYAACMDDRTIESNALRPLEAELARIAAVANKEDLPPLVAHLHSLSVNVLFRFGVRTDLRDATRQVANADQGGLGLPDRDYYLKTDERSVELRQQYQNHLRKMLGMLTS